MNIFDEVLFLPEVKFADLWKPTGVCLQDERDREQYLLAAARLSNMKVFQEKLKYSLFAIWISALDIKRKSERN